MKIKNPFEFEKIRSKLAEDRKFIELEKTYSGATPTISASNKGPVWDKLNRSFINSISHNPMAVDKFRIVNAWIDRRSPSKVLNVGFGNGILESMVHNIHANIDWNGIDISKKFVREMSSKYQEWKFSTQSIESMKLSTKTYDLIICLDVLEHIHPSNALNCIRKISAALTTRGELILSVPLNENLEKMVKAGSNPNHHVRVYTEQLVKAELEICGLNVVEEKSLYAFNNYYHLKKLLALVFDGIRKPNLIILRLRKHEGGFFV